ncbi:GH25 family lysozyme [Heyndrickxia sporothermodurans]|nr:GH25 family lysozyme [Heyndrickxia sporothermodurans]MBL5799487.1 N-acetylmuramoyl-L-alanine amidase [Heyndrickxia sporothermodurans]MBL5817503.1 N-acetylmuramoyl-L-alanine amidase [Heyndrickxia sporothermodurans]
MGIIMDISHHQPSNKIDWAKAAKEVDLVIIRVQYGSNLIDREYKNHVANCKKYGIPFGHYAYGMFVSVNDAIVEAKDFINRADNDALFLALDVEGDTVKSCGTKDLAKASQAFIDVLKDVGYKTGFYVSHELYKKYDLDKVKADFLWLPRYGKDNGKPDKKPDYPCCLWQYSQYCKVDWYKGGLDFNLLNGDKSLEWFTGKKKTTPVNKPKKKTESKPVSKPKDEKYTVVKT